MLTLLAYDTSVILEANAQARKVHAQAEKLSNSLITLFI